MFTIDGLVSGLDTTAIIEGMLSLKQKQIDRYSIDKELIVSEQSAFKGIEARVLALQNSLNSLTSFVDNVFQGSVATSSDESIVMAAASKQAVPGIFRLAVTQLASAEQVASQGFLSAESLVTQGSLSIQVGSRQSFSIDVTAQNNTVTGLVNSINDAEADVTASLITDGSGARILLTSKHSGAANTVSIVNNLGGSAGGATQPDFSGPLVQAASDSTVVIGSGAGAISINNSTNIVEGVIAGVTLDLKSADISQQVTINVERDAVAANEAIAGFVESFNEVMKYVNEQTKYVQETEQAGILQGNRNATSIQQQLRETLIRVLPNLGSHANRLSTIGIKFDQSGTLTFNESQLSRILSGQDPDVSITDVRRIFALDGQIVDPNIDFIVGTSKTRASNTPYQVVVTQAAQRASLTASQAISGSVIIDQSNKDFSVTLDGAASGTLSLTEGSYTADQLAAHMQEVINQAPDLNKRSVAITNAAGTLSLTSNRFGSSSEVSQLSGALFTTLGFSGSSRGLDVAGYFLVDGQTETASGNGRILAADVDNTNTSGIQLEVTLTSSQLTGPYQVDLTVTRGFAAQLDQLVESMMDPEKGRFGAVDNSYDQQVESIDASIERINTLFEAEKERLQRQFIALETKLSQLQSTSSALSTQLANAISLRR